VMGRARRAPRRAVAASAPNPDVRSIVNVS
jgi:hypothetical protein